MTLTRTAWARPRVEALKDSLTHLPPGILPGGDIATVPVPQPGCSQRQRLVVWFVARALPVRVPHCITEELGSPAAPSLLCVLAMWRCRIALR